MSSETRTMLVVLLVCGFLMCGCIVLPIGVGVGFFYVAAARSQVAMQEAIAQERAAVARAQADAQSALKAMQESLPTPPTETPRAPDAGSQATPPAFNLPPLGGLAGGDLTNGTPQIDVEALFTDVEQRKRLYKAFKLLRDIEGQNQKPGEADPTGTSIVAALKQQALDLAKAQGVTQEHIDKIMAEGDKEGW